MSILKRIYAIAGFMILSINSPVFAQSVESISDEVLNDVSPDELYWVVEVTCVDTQGGRTMQQRAGESNWCAADFPELCGATKTSLAQQLCSQEYNSLATTEVTESADVIAAQEQERQERQEQARQEQARQEQARQEQARQEQARQEQARQEQENQASTIAQPEVAPAVDSSVMTAEEIAIEEELIRIEEELLELRLKEIELQ